jgi:hypothetical protein
MTRSAPRLSTGMVGANLALTMGLSILLTSTSIAHWVYRPTRCVCLHSRGNVKATNSCSCSAGLLHDTSSEFTGKYSLFKAVWPSQAVFSSPTHPSCNVEGGVTVVRLR